ncbi:MAG: recombination protein RecR [Parcubacteria group bacterium]|nr:recombination protein RecR [Parcubacteria group bacterium]
MNTISKLTELFSKFPGIGPRQAKRFVYFLLTRNSSFLEELARLLLELKKEVSTCESCMRFFSNSLHNTKICEICRDPNRNGEMLMIVERDADFENIEKSKIYEGKYFILGGKVPILEKNPENRIRVSQLKERIKDTNIKEVILALSVNPDGENTEKYVRDLLPSSCKITILGRGLSTGIELEYPDSDTLKNAFKNRT